MTSLRRCCVFVFSILITAPAFAATYFVRTGGNDQADGATPATAFATPLRAVQAANHGDSIVIGPGRYQTNALLAERFGLPDARIQILGDETGQQTGDPAGPVVLEPATPGSPTLYLLRLRHVTVSGLTFVGGEGVRVEQCRDAIIERCTFDQTARGLSADGTLGLRIEASVFSRNVVAMFLQGSSQIRVAHVTVAGSSAAGVLALRCGDGEIRNSIFAENNSAYVLDNTSSDLWTSDHNVVAGTVGPWGKVPLSFNAYEWFAASGQERHSSYVIPAFANPEQFDLRIDPKITWGGGLPGMYVGAKLDPPVKLDRAGQPLERQDGSAGAGAYAYPQPQAGEGWKKVADLKVDPNKPRQSAGIYTEDGTLIRTLIGDDTAIRELWWDGLDDSGQPAAGGRYQVRAVAHDVKILDDGNVADNGNAKGAYHPDAAERFAVFADGSYISVTMYDEAGFPMRLYSPSGQPLFASNLAEKDLIAIAADGQDIYAVIGKPQSKLARLRLPGERANFPNGAESLPIFNGGDAAAGVAGLSVAGGKAYVALPGMDLIRIIDLSNGNKVADWPLPQVGDLARDESGTLWAISGTEIVSLDANGKVVKRVNSTLTKPAYLAVHKGRIATVDRAGGRVAILDAGSGNVLKTYGKPRPPLEFTPVSLDKLRDPRGVAFLPDGKLLLAEQARIRCFWPESGKIAYESISNFMETAVVHPTDPSIVYMGMGIFRVDPKTGAWAWLAESPRIEVEREGQKRSITVGSPTHAVVLGGKPFIAYHVPASHTYIFDVSDPLKPRAAGTIDPRNGHISGWAYATFAFTKDGHIISQRQHYTLQFSLIPFKGLDAKGNPQFDFANAKTFGSEKDPLARNMQSAVGITADITNGDIYYLAITDAFRKLVPGWGADGTGIGKSLADGTPKWFALSSGGNYMSVSAANNGRQTLILAGKSFGGQLDVFDSDGLRLGTGNWSWPSHYHIGFVDLRYGVHAYVRPDGKIGAYVEDDAIGRFGRARIDGDETIARQTLPFDHAGDGAPASKEPPIAAKVSGKTLQRVVPIPRINSLPVDGNWDALAAAGVQPQILALPSSVSFARNVPPDVMSDFREGTMIGAVAHDGSHLYTYFLVTDATMNFDSPQSGNVWMYDGVELWLEEEQFGLSFVRDGTPVVHKFRHHSREGKPFAANYRLPRENVWAEKIDDLSTHPLARQLEAATGTALAGKRGYAVMAKIPFPDIKLVGGIAGRAGGSVSPVTGEPGELIRIAVALGAVSGKGREQDYKVNWPASLMFADPTRSTVFEFK